MNFTSLKNELTNSPIRISAPCRIDCGGTFDIKTFSVPMHSSQPCTFNIALNIRTTVTLYPWQDGVAKVSSRGFASEEFEAGKAPFNSPMGLVFAALYFFGFSGIHVDIVSDSPPKSALGGSSTMLVTVIGALNKACEQLGQPTISIEEIVKLAYQVEDGISSYTCGIQDHLASAYGGVNQWFWHDGTGSRLFSQKALLVREDKDEIDRAIAVAFCGITHDSGTINRKWIDGFCRGENRPLWTQILEEVKSFCTAVSEKNWAKAAEHIRKENDLRKKLTPEVFTKTGYELVHAAEKVDCGARFTGSGGGGCLWAIGEHANIAKLKKHWESILKEEGGMLPSDTDFDGIKDETI